MVAAVMTSILREGRDILRARFGADTSLVASGIIYIMSLTHLIRQLIETESKTPFFGGLVSLGEVKPFISDHYVRWCEVVAGGRNVRYALFHVCMINEDADRVKM